MADFAAWVVAAEDSLGWPRGSFLDAYVAGANEAQDIVLEASVIGEPLREHVESVKRWEGTAQELLTILAERVSEDVRRSKAWPRTARGFSGAIRRLAPTLRTLGIAASFGRGGTRARKRTITLELIRADSTVQTVQPSGQAPFVVDDADGMDGSSTTSEPQVADALSSDAGWELEVEVPT